MIYSILLYINAKSQNKIYTLVSNYFVKGGILRGNMTKNGKSDKQLHERLHECENELTSKNKEVLKLERQVKKLESKVVVLPCVVFII